MKKSVAPPWRQCAGKQVWKKEQDKLKLIPKHANEKYGNNRTTYTQQQQQQQQQRGYSPLVYARE